MMRTPSIASLGPVPAPENEPTLQSITRNTTSKRDDNALEATTSHQPHGLARILSRRSKAASEVDDVPPDGGYGWVVVACVFFVNASTWGVNSSYGVFLAHYLANNTYPEATPLMYAFVGGLSISAALLVSPLVNTVLRLTSTQTGMLIGVFFETGGFIAASFATRIWHLFLTQGVVFGIGLGFLFSSSVGTISQWFSKKRSVANGITAAGSGVGGLAYSLGVRAMLTRLSLAWTFRIVGLTTLAVNAVCILLIRDRNKQIKPNQRAFDMSLLRRYQVILLVLWGIFSMFGYVVILFSLPDYARAQGFSTNQGSILSALLNLGMTFGRPTVGFLSDRWGRLNVGGIMTLITGLSCFIIWMPAGKNFGVAVLFSLVNGAVCGTFWTTIAPITVEVVGIKDLPAALSVMWMGIVIPTTFSEAIALYIRRPNSSNPYLFPQLWSGLMFLAAAVTMWLLRAWKLGDNDRKAMEGSHDTMTDEKLAMEIEGQKGWMNVRSRWENQSRFWRYAYV